MSLEPVHRQPGTTTIKLVTTESQRDTYSYARAAVAHAATPTDIFLLTGSATKTIKIKRVFINANGSASGIMNALCVKRTADNTGGTRASVVSSIAKYDSKSPTATAVPYTYSTNPSSLGAGANLFADNLVFGNSGNPITAEIEFAIDNLMPPTLRGTSEFFCINMNGDAVPSGGEIGFVVVWEEYSDS